MAAEDFVIFRVIRVKTFYTHLHTYLSKMADQVLRELEAAAQIILVSYSLNFLINQVIFYKITISKYLSREIWIAPCP